MERKLASIQKITAINPIPDADNIEVASVLGWKVVVKKGEFQVNDLAVYIEIDAFVPNTVAPFLTAPERFPKVFNNVEGERLRTVKKRKQISQGLLLPLTVLNERYNEHELHEYWNEGDDVAELLDIQKWEAPIDASVAGTMKGGFPGFLHKTDEERVQNMPHILENFAGTQCYITEKLDGSSMTVYNYGGEFGVCSRNTELKETENNALWMTARKMNLDSLLPDGYAVQGELIGEKIQGNKYKINGVKYYIYNVWSIYESRYLNYLEFIDFCSERNLLTVPIISGHHELRNSVDYYIELADGKSDLHNVNREGLVIRSKEHIDNERLSFKAISNKFLLKNEE